jgi:DNA replication protein DnaC
MLAQLIELTWIDQHLNVLITRPTGVGKSHIASALAMQACRQDHSVRYFRLPRLADQLILAGAQLK